MCCRRLVLLCQLSQLPLYLGVTPIKFPGCVSLLRLSEIEIGHDRRTFPGSHRLHIMQARQIAQISDKVVLGGWVHNLLKLWRHDQEVAMAG